MLQWPVGGNHQAAGFGSGYLPDAGNLFGTHELVALIAASDEGEFFIQPSPVRLYIHLQDIWIAAAGDLV